MNLAVNFLTKGVVGSGDLLVQQQGTPNMTVLVATGKVYVLNGAGSMMYLGNLTATQNVTIAANASGNPRIDAVVVKIDTVTTPDNTASNIATLVAVQGTPAASPTAPSDGTIQTAVGAGNAFYRLADVTVANGAASITTANISDKRSQAVLNAGFQSGFSAYASAGTYSIPDSTWTKLQLNTEVYDTLSEYDPTTNYRFTASKTGKYLITATAIMSGLVSGKLFQIAIYKNGSSYKQDGKQSANNGFTFSSIHAIVDLAANDYVEVFVNQDSGGALNVNGGSTVTYVMGQRLV